MNYMLIHHPVLGYLDAHDGNGEFEWTDDPEKAWPIPTEQAGARLKNVLRYKAHVRLVNRKGAPKHQSVRRFWTPKLKPCVTQCQSCPFKKGNDEQFGVVVGKLKLLTGDRAPVTPDEVEHARRQVKE
jgi:hypothetical protein